MTVSPSQTTVQRKMKPSSIVYWSRLALAILAGFTNHFLRIQQATYGELAIFVAVGVGILFFLVSVALVKYVYHYGEAELKGKNRYITLGAGTFIIVWIMTSVLFFTLWG